MGVPKKRKSHMRTRTHRSHNALKVQGWVSCPQCKEPMQLHKICKGCGYYRSKQVIDTQA